VAEDLLRGHVGQLAGELAVAAVCRLARVAAMPKSTILQVPS
jgi:hypothetical protein